MRKPALSVFLAACLAVLSLLCVFPSAAEETVDVLSSPLPLLVNKDYPVSDDFVPADLVLLSDVLDSSIVRIKGNRKIYAVRAAAEALETMLEAARDDGIRNWQVSTAYRSIADQQKVMNNRINYYRKKNPSWSKSRAKSAALRSVAEPGCSEHHLGLAFDINVPNTSAFKGTKQCKWLHEHCWDYGFIVRYQEDKTAITGFTAEEWHIRYVGVEHSVPMRDNNFCLEEYLESVEAEPGFLLVEEIPADELPVL